MVGYGYLGTHSYTDSVSAIFLGQLPEIQ